MNDWYDGPRKYEPENTMTPGERALAELAKLPPAASPGQQTGRQIYTDRIVEVLSKRGQELSGVECDIVPEPSDWDKARKSLKLLCIGLIISAFWLGAVSGMIFAASMVQK